MLMRRWKNRNGGNKSTLLRNEDAPPPPRRQLETTEATSDTGAFPGLRTASTMEQNSCTSFFLILAIVMDVVGLLLLLIGIFAPLSFWDFLVLSGPLIIFFSLVFWIFWYLGNLTVSEEELNLPKHDVL